MTCDKLLRVLMTSLATLAWTTECTAYTDQPADVSEKSIRLKDASWQEVQKFVATQKGRIVVLDLWSTGCPPCMKEFPNLIDLQRRHPKKLVCVSLNIDYAGIRSKPPSYYRPHIEKFLKSRQAAIHNFMCTTDSDKVLEELDIFSIPAVFVYGPDGKLVRQFDDSLIKPGKKDAFTYKEDIIPFVESLLPNQ